MEVAFPGPGLEVSARFDGFVVSTDQPQDRGGAGTAPSPFDLFLASLGTCAGYAVLGFLRHRGLPTEGAVLELDAERDPETHMVSRIELMVSPPEGFPRKYERAIIRAVQACSVKKHLHEPPAFATVLKIDGSVAARSGI